MPLYRRMPKLVGRPMGPGHVRANYGLLKIDILNKAAPNSEVTYESLLKDGLMNKVAVLMSITPRARRLTRPAACAAAHQEGHVGLPRPPARQGYRLQQRRPRDGCPDGQGAHPPPPHSPPPSASALCA